jgi:trigger factor
MADATETETPRSDTSGVEVTVEEGPDSTRRLSVRVAPERAERIRAREREELGKSVRLDGFRPGKVPARVLEERYGEVVDERVRRSGVEEAVREVLEDADFRPVERPEVRSVSYEKGGELTFEAQVEVAPTLELERIGGFRLERPSAEVPEEDVEEVLDRLRDDHALWAPATRTPVDGDQVAVHITPVDESGEPLEDEGDSDPYRFELGEGYAIPEVEASIKTLEPGESGEFDVTFPGDFDNPELAGVSRRLRIDLLEVKEKDVPPLDDRLAAEIGDFESVEELRSTVTEDLRSHREEEAEEAIRRSLLDSIVEANPFEVPDAMVERYLDRVIDAPEDADPGRVQEARRSFRDRAEREVKHQLVLDHLMEREGFEATEEEVDERIREIAEGRDEDPDDLRTRLARQRQLDGVRRHVATEKLFEHLKEQSEVR